MQAKWAVAQSLAAARLALASATLAFALTFKGNALSKAVASFQTRTTLLLVRLSHHGLVCSHIPEHSAQLCWLSHGMIRHLPLP